MAHSDVYRFFQRVFERAPTTDDSARVLRAVVLLLLGLSVGTGSAAADTYLHRGIESGTERPYVLHATGHELAINVDLLQYAGQIDQIGALLQQRGFRYVRQPFLWSRIEPQQGTFDWQAYDQIVQGMAKYGLQVVAVVEGTPQWARNPAQATVIDGPPVKTSDYAAVVGQIVGRYKNTIQFVQIWDLPNRADHWGGQRATPRDYLALLAEAFNAARTANSETKVVLAEFDPSPDGGGTGADIEFLRGIYAAKGAPFFDIVAARIEGGTASPYDRQVDAGVENFSRAVLFRELLEQELDAAKPIWLTHYGWNAVDGGPVERDDQADFTTAALTRARSEWPWLGLMFSWSLFPNQSDPAEAGQSLLTQDGLPTPLFNALTQFESDGGAGVASTGYVPMDSAPVTYQGNWEEQHLERQTFQFTTETGATATLQFRGTGVIAILRFSPQSGPLTVAIDGKPVDGWPIKDGQSVIDLQSGQAFDVPISIADGLKDTRHTLTMSLRQGGELTIGGLIVARQPPLLWPVAVLVLIAIITAAIGLRDIVYVVALRSRLLQRRNQIGMRPPLPRLPDWRPSRRY